MSLSCASGAVGEEHSFNTFLAHQHLRPVSGQRGQTLRLTPLLWRPKLRCVISAGAAEGSHTLAGSSRLWWSLQNMSGGACLAASQHCSPQPCLWWWERSHTERVAKFKPCQVASGLRHLKFSQNRAAFGKGDHPPPFSFLLCFLTALAGRCWEGAKCVRSFLSLSPPLLPSAPPAVSGAG